MACCELPKTQEIRTLTKTRFDLVASVMCVNSITSCGFFFFFPLRNNPPVLGLTVFIYSVFLFGGRSVAMATEAALLVRVIYHHRSMWE